MKPLRWIIALLVAAVVLTAAFFVIDSRQKKQKERAEIGAGKTLFSFDSSLLTRITIDNEEGHFAFDWDDIQGWQLVSSEKFPINPYAVAAIGEYFSNLQSVKTVAFNCQDTAVYGFANPVVLKAYTSETGSENPYVLYIGDPTPTYDSYYAMTDASDDVYTIDYNSGSIFCVAKDTLKNAYLFDSLSSSVKYYHLERDGETVMELDRDSDYLWQLKQPAQYELNRAAFENDIDSLVRIKVNSFVEEHPTDLAQYGLEHPRATLTVRATSMEDVIMLGDACPSTDGSNLLYGYLKGSEQVFRVLYGDVKFILENTAANYLVPVCQSVSVAEISAVEIDMGDIYDMHETLYMDYSNKQYSLGDTDITALGSEKLDSLFAAYFNSIAELRFYDIDPKAKPEGDTAMRITYTYLDGSTAELEFIQESENSFWLMKNGKYSGLVVRMNNFTAANSIIPNYEALMEELNK